jgi:hypothetical protein
MSEMTQPTARLRASLANAAFAVEDRVAIGGAEVARGALEGAKRAAEVAKWPFERLVWAVQEHLLWPLQDRVDGWSQTARRASAAGVGVVAIGACALGLVLASGGSGSESKPVAASAPAPAPPVPAPVEKAPPAPVLHGVAPVLAAKAGANAAKAAGATAKAEGDAPKQTSPTAAAGEPAGPAALKVARRFADAFVLYEVGKGSDTAKTAFQATATPELARDLLSRPPRLPADVKVPQAKVVNVVAGPSRAGVFPISVSLLRVGVTSELRLNMQKQGEATGPSDGAAGKTSGGQKEKQTGKKEIWLVTDVTG